ncbi:MAG: tripartite tricarboxylate transporter TctB family protein [Rhizobiales bacterium]|nr:tripartite tricarboxylate transporter TctB family protein [Hyphomicrobiales bacterium]
MSLRAGWSGLAALFAVALCAVAFALRYGIWVDAGPGPGLFPLIAALLIVIASPAVALELARPVPAQPDTGDEHVGTPGRLLTYMAVALAWPFLLEPLGYAPASAVAVLVLLVAGGVGWIASLAVTAAAVGGSYLLFDTLLEVPLPGSDWF